MDIQKLKESRAAHVKAAKSISDSATDTINPEQSAKIDEHLAAAESFTAQIARAEKIEAGVKQIEAVAPRKAVDDGEIPDGIVTGGEKRNDLKATTHGFANLGEYAMSVYSAGLPGRRGADERLQFGASASGMSQGVAADGGFTVPPTFSTAIWNGISNADDSFASLTDNYTVEGESLTFLANAETSRASTIYGGSLGYWISEAGQINSSKPTFRQVKVEPQQVAALVYVTEKLLRNSAVGLEQYITRASTAAIKFKVGDALINGSGSGQPKGLMSSGSIISVAKETSQAAATFNKKNANKMWGRLHPNCRANAVWLMNVDVEPQLDEFFTAVTNVAGSENVGGFGSMVYNAEKGTLKGRPIIFSEFCATLGTTGDVILVDPKGYITGTRGGVDSAVSMHLRFDYAESAFRFIYEIDGQPWLASALTPYKGSATLSTHVKLDTRS